MKKPRLHRWRLLLALLLGVGTWWGIGWWLSPRVYWEKQYLLKVPGVERTQKLPSRDSELAPFETSARLWDREGRYLLVEQPFQANANRYALIDLQTRRTVAENTLNFSDPIRLDEERLLSVKADHYRLAHPNGIAQLPIMKWRDDPPEVVTALWEWNPFTNALRCSREFPRAEKLEMSYDGSVLLEAERCTPLWPSLLLPMNLAQGLAGLAEARVQSTDLVVLRLWSLPELKLLATIMSHHLAREENLGNIALTRDGKYVIAGAATMPAGYTSPQSYLVSESRSKTDRRIYVHEPASIQVFDVHTGAKVWDKSDATKWYHVDKNLHTDDMIVFYSDGLPSSLHLPTKTWLPGINCKSSQRLSASSFHSVHFTHVWNVPPILVNLSNHGTVAEVSRLKSTSDYWEVIPNAPQVLIQSSYQKYDTLLEWLRSILWDFELTRDWMEKSHEYLHV